MQDKELIFGDPVENDVRKSEDRETAVSCVVDNAADFWECRQRIDARFNCDKYMSSAGRTAIIQICGDTFKIA